MSYEIPGMTLTLESDTDNSLNMFRGVVVTAVGNQFTLAGAGAKIMGVLQNKPGAVGRAGTIMMTGITKGVAGAPIAAGAALSMDANGRFVPQTGTAVTVGFALEAAVTTLDLLPVRLYEN